MWFRTSPRHPEVAGEAGPRRMNGPDVATAGPSPADVGFTRHRFSSAQVGQGRLAAAVATRGHLRVTALALAILAAILWPSHAHAQDHYPNRPITLVIPLPPGGTHDIMARSVADKL